MQQLWELSVFLITHAAHSIVYRQTIGVTISNEMCHS